MPGTPATSPRVAVVEGNVLDHGCDVLVLKHAQSLHGADKAVYSQLVDAGLRPRLPAAGADTLIKAQGAVAAGQVLFVGVERLLDFGYAEIRAFGRRALGTLAKRREPAREVAMTLHGPGYGLDEAEAFKSQLAGVVDAIESGRFPADLEQVRFIERDRPRARRLQALLQGLVPGGGLLARTAGQREVKLQAASRQVLQAVGESSRLKPKLFVAMPFAAEMDDVYHYGIRGAAEAADALAERTDLQSYTGDVMEFVRKRIEGAKLVIADLTGANPNVFLEVGYAMARGVPTVLLARAGEKVPFDLHGQRRLEYRSIQDLENKLTAELRTLLATEGERPSSAPEPDPA